MDFGEAKRILAALERERVRYVLIGSMAMAAQGLIRATRGMDLFVSPEPDNVACLRRALKSRVATPRALYRMKKGTVRPQDRIDAEAIRERFDVREDEEDES